LNKWKIKLLSKKDRYRIFKKRLKDLVYRLKAQGKNLFNIRSETLKNYLLQKGTESFIKE